MTRPRYCPNCGVPLSQDPNAAVPFRTRLEGSGWDCYCDACKWSGDIMPDDEEGEHHAK